MTMLVFEELGIGTKHAMRVGRVLVAGFTGRDQEGAVAERVSELASAGESAPDATPAFYHLTGEMVRQTEILVVHGDETSGEVEPVVVRANGQLFLTVGSDHTDRALQREDIALSKADCPKVIARSWVGISEIGDWDAVRLTSRVHDGLYQDDTLSSLLPLERILEHLEQKEAITLREGDVLFLGTIPVKGDIRPSPIFSATMHLSGLEDEISFSYRVVHTSSTSE